MISDVEAESEEVVIEVGVSVSPPTSPWAKTVPVANANSRSTMTNAARRTNMPIVRWLLIHRNGSGVGDVHWFMALLSKKNGNTNLSTVFRFEKIAQIKNTQLTKPS